MNRSTTSSRRSGYTLVEILVVVGLIAFLVTLSVGVLRNAIVSAKERATEATLVKINGLVQQRVDALNRALEKTNMESATQYLMNQLTPGGKPNQAMRRAAEIMMKKDIFRSRFPQNFEEKNLLLAPPAGVTITASAHKHETQSAALLYWLLTASEVYGVGPVDESAFGSAEVKDTDGDGLMEFIDGWGRPLRFYRWPTRLFRCGEDFNGNGALDAGEDEDGDGALDSVAGYTTTSPVIRKYANQIWSGLPAKPTAPGEVDPLARDPDDPLGMILRAANYKLFPSNASGSSPSAAQSISNFETGILAKSGPEVPFHTMETYHAYLIVSAGPDGQLGLHEPSEGWPNGTASPPSSTVPIVTTVGRLAGLTQLGSLDNHPINDNLTNRKR